MNTSDYISPDKARSIVKKLTLHNQLVCDIMSETGLRVGDVVALRRDQVEAVTNGWLTITEQKTGKKRSVRFSKPLIERCLWLGGKKYIFPNQRDPERHRSRQSVWRQLKDNSEDTPERVTPHSFRKQYAVRKLQESGDIEKVQRDLKHKYVSTTMVYALSDMVTALKLKKGG